MELSNRLGRVISTSHNGTVHIDSMDETRVIKVIKIDERLNLERDLDQLLEPKILRLSHQHLCECYSQVQVGSLVYLHLCRYKQTLHDYLEALNQPLDISTIIEISRQIAQALRFLHEQGYLHLDIHPRNVMIKDTPKITIALIDFGVSEPNNGQQDYVFNIDNSPYCSPDLALGRYSSASDVWSLGLIMLGMLSPEPKFFTGRPDIQQSLSNIEDHPLKSLVTSMLSREPKKRPTIDQIITLLSVR